MTSQEKANQRWKLRHPLEAKKRPYRYNANTYVRRYANAFELRRLIDKAHIRLRQLSKEGEK